MTLQQVLTSVVAPIRRAAGWTRLRLLALIQSQRARRRAIGVAIAVFAIWFVWHGFARVAEGEVGVLVNNVTGNVEVEQRAGYHVFFPWAMTLYRLDRRVQGLSMSDAGGDGFRGGDAVKIKTSDGSNVSLDIQVSFRIIPERAGDVLRESGPDLSFGELWVRSAVRAMVGREFGKLTTEQVYDASLRNDRAHAVVEQLNRELATRGVEIVAVVPQELRFYKEYEEIIKKKKLADQEVEEQRAKARLATEEQKKRVAEAEFSAKAKIASAQGEAERTQAEADGYDKRVRLESEGELAKLSKQGDATLATGMGEAEGLRQAASALGGPGGVNLVALEYAKQLQRINFTGVPVMQDNRVGQFRVQQGDAAAVTSNATTAARTKP